MAPSQESLYPFRHEGSVRSPGRYWFFWALVFAAGSLLSCGRDDTRTCLELTITYAGSKSGAAYLRVVSDDGGQSYFIGGNAASIQFLILAESGGVTCSGGSVNRGDIPLTATAWIDVSGAGAATCSDLHNPQCQPSPSDSQAHQSAVLRFGQLTQIRLDVVDQP